MINKINRWKTMDYKTGRLERLMEDSGLIKKGELLEGEALIIERMKYKLRLWKKQGYRTERLEYMLNEYLK